MTTQHILMHHDDHTDTTDIFGFWIYIMSDCILFATIFAAFAVLHTNVYGSPSIKELTSISQVLIQTIVLLTSSFTCGLAILSLYNNDIKKLIFWLVNTFFLGAVFVLMEASEFTHLYIEGFSWKNSAALSSFFTTVGTHGLHVTVGLVWMFVLILQIMVFGLTPVVKKRLTYFGLFWAFLDIIWIFVFTIVYLMGKI